MKVPSLNYHNVAEQSTASNGCHPSGIYYTLCQGISEQQYKQGINDDFYPAFCQPNVEVVTERIREVRAHSILTDDGREHEIDAIICGTGFHVRVRQGLPPPW